MPVGQGPSDTLSLTWTQEHASGESGGGCASEGEG